jgi:adenylylsulfate kinase-like enzyme
VFAVIITGPPGAGKSAVLTALVDDLIDDDVANAALDVDEVVRSHPMLDDALWRRQVGGIAALFRDAGHRLLIVAETLETDADTARLLEALGAGEHLLVRLEAPADTLAARIIEREPESWSGRDGLVESARRLAGTMPALRGVDLVLSTEGERPEAVAARIRAARPDRLAPGWR